jgi:thioredoxin 1
MSVLHVTVEDFEKEVLQAEKPVLVDFWATWCGPCKMISPIIEELASESSEVKFCKVNVDEQSTLAQKYRIMSIPTLLVIKDGEVVNTSVGLKSKSDIQAMLQV